MCLKGTMASCIAIVPEAHFHMRPLQQCFSAEWSQVEGQLAVLVLVKANTHFFLQGWASNSLLQGGPFLDSIPHVTITTDTAQAGWEAHLIHNTMQGI